MICCTLGKHTYWYTAEEIPQDNIGKEMNHTKFIVVFLFLHYRLHNIWQGCNIITRNHCQIHLFFFSHYRLHDIRQGCNIITGHKTKLIMPNLFPSFFSHYRLHDIWQGCKIIIRNHCQIHRFFFHIIFCTIFSKDVTLLPDIKRN